MSDKSTETNEYRYGKQAFDQGLSSMDNPYHSWYNKKEYFDWARGWWEKNNYYETLSRDELRKEFAIEEERILKEQEQKREEEAAKKAEEKYKKSKKGKAEAAGQGSLFG